MKKSLFSYLNSNVDDLKKLNVGKAFDMSIDSANVDEFFKNSGFIFFLDILLKDDKYKNKISSVFIDFSTLGSLIKEDVLYSFIGVWNKDEEKLASSIDPVEVQNNYLQVVNTLQKINKGPYYHSDFFYKPTNPEFYYSLSNTIDETKYSSSISDFFSEYNKIPQEGKQVFKLFSSPIYQGFKIQKAPIKISFDNLLKKFENDKFPIGDRHELLHILYDNLFCKKGNCITCLLSIPILGLNATDKHASFAGQGALFVYFTLKEPPSDFENTIDDISFKYSLLLKDYVLNYLFELGQSSAKLSATNARKSAMAAIMSRNISHNLGSHVLSYVKSDLSSTEHILESGVIDDMLNDNLTLIKPVFAKNDEENKKIYKRIQEKIKQSRIKHQKDYENKPSASYLLGLSHLLNYIQERQDYIATIASATIPYFSAINFKDHILDEFTHDAKAKRHKDSQEPQQNLLLKYIALSEQKTRNFYPSDLEGSKNNIEFKLIYKSYDIEEPVCFETYNPGSEVINSRLRSINVEIPAGIMGRQAFFSILENIIRNTAKHASIQGRMLFEIEVEEKVEEGEFYTITIFTNEKETDTKKLDIVKNLLNDKLKSELIKEDGSVEESNKGLKEIYISAAWLINVILPSAKNTQEPIVKVILNDREQLGFQFKLFKARKVALVVSGKEKKEALEDALNNEPGWKIFEVNEFLNNKFSYRLYVIDSEIQSQQYLKNSIDNRYPSRKYFTPLDSTIFKNENLNSLYLTWLEEYLFKRFGKLPKIVIADEKEWPIFDSDNIFSTGTSAWHEIIKGETLFFKKHLNELSEYTGYLSILNKFEELQSQIIFTESITGHNSTERLVRHEQLDREWWLKMVESSLAKILIIDERLWQKVTDAEVFLEKQRNPRDVVKEIIESALLQDEKSAEIMRQYPQANYDYVLQAVYDNENEPLYEQVDKFGFTNKIKVKDDFKYELYKGNGIQIGSFLFDESDREYKMYILPEKNFDNIHNENVASISANGEVKVLQPFEFNFDFVLVHQGILDKFVIQAEDEISAAGRIFKRIKKIVSPNDKQREPVYIIHSGRSKPPPDTYPDPSVPFIQYSSVESSFNDCKYTLTELLHSAINID